MDIRNPMRLSLGLAVAILVTGLLADVTRLSIFTWLEFILSVWLFLNLYWIVICLLAYLRGYRSGKEMPESIEQFMSLDTIPTVPTFEPIIPAKQPEALQKPDRNKENLQWN